MPEIYELWGCPECGKVHDEEHQALECCEEYTRCPGCARDFGRGHINHFAIQLSGHCNVCVPFFTVEQQLIIEDRHSQYLGEPGPRLNS
ncbi:hypothetical protein LNN38_21180 [Pseudomonas sp. LA21]|uniref:hypothetical protein n=1 Tax=Pseudomonas sp. LA21 TaxID=2893373 RepID=UPI001FB7C882|nr:hypothetical protein [Pseudomonas sp. LA21]MCJ1887388.1 hypothetical protein [Pseudomonas sp. LA21]